MTVTVCCLTEECIRFNWFLSSLWCMYTEWPEARNSWVLAVSSVNQGWQQWWSPRTILRIGWVNTHSKHKYSYFHVQGKRSEGYCRKLLIIWGSEKDASFERTIIYRTQQFILNRYLLNEWPSNSLLPGLPAACHPHILLRVKAKLSPHHGRADLTWAGSSVSAPSLGSFCSSHSGLLVIAPTYPFL